MLILANHSKLELLSNITNLLILEQFYQKAEFFKWLFQLLGKYTVQGLQQIIYFKFHVFNIR